MFHAIFQYVSDLTISQWPQTRLQQTLLHVYNYNVPYINKVSPDGT